MRVLLVSDLHANPYALAALPPADAVLCAGDLVDYGPDPRGAIAWCRANADAVAHGNHDRALAFDEDDGVGSAMQAASAATRALHKTLVAADDLTYLRSLPRIAVRTLGGTTFAVAHGVADDPRRYAALGEAAESVSRAVPPADVVLVGHTHVQGTMTIGDRIAVNPGSVGMATHGGEAHYALWTDGKIELRAVSYDVDAMLRALALLRLPTAVHAALSTAFREGRARTSR
jgi:putative phosphoesterase